MFFNNIIEIIEIVSQIAYDPSNKSNSSFQVGANILDVLLLYADV